MRLHTTPLHRPASTSSSRARPSLLSCRAGEARTVAREQRRKEAAMNSKSPSPSPRSVAVDGTDSTPSLKQPAPLSGSQNVAQPSPSGRLSPQEVVSNLERGNREDESNELGIDSARRGPKKTQPPKKPSLFKKKKKKLKRSPPPSWPHARTLMPSTP